MTDIRPLDDEAQYRAANTLFRATLHYPPATDEAWAFVRNSYEPGRAFAEYDGDETVGTVMSFPSSLVLPGGAVVPHAAVSRVGVRPDHTRRGVLSRLTSIQFSSLTEPVATLRASEGLIYGRFGYGVATHGRTVKIDRRRASIAGSPSGRVRMIDHETAGTLLPSLYDRIGLHRPGTIGRGQGWWDINLRANLKPDDNLVSVVHSGPDGDDGFLVYKVEQEKEQRILRVHDLCVRDTAAWASLWRYALSVDLVDEIEAWLRPLDEPLEWLLTDARAMKVTEVEDETWLRLLDVPRMLAARTYGLGDPVVLAVTDTFLPANSGTYRITPDGAARTAAAADIEIDVDLLAAVYFGDTTFTQLAAAGRIKATDTARADRLFAVDTTAWCGTYF